MTKKKKRISLIKVVSLIFYGIVLVAALMLISGLKKIFESPDEVLVNPVEEIPNQQIKKLSKELNARYPFTDRLKKRTEEVEREKMQKIQRNQSEASRVKGTHYRIQVGSFTDKSKAEEMRENMTLLDYPALIAQSGKQHLVQVGPYLDRDEALAVENQLKKNGYNAVLKTYK